MLIGEILTNLSLPLKIYIAYSLLINSISFGITAYDKFLAVRKRHRVAETAILALALIGGAAGVLMSMVMLHHKISKRKFYIGVPLLLLVNKVFDLLILYYS